ncbi:MAG TPA: hypothetical protein VFF33_02355 [Ignavibacteriaceae bacterium]|nr:hypothetical protein [Ignavibacteriaceae bacterium]
MERKFTFFISLIVAFVCLGINIQAQIISTNYSFSRSGFAPTDISTGNTQLIGPNSNEVASAVTDIGFTFWFAGIAYTQFSVNENGVMTLGNTPIPGNASLNQLSTSSISPIIAPYWDDLATGTNGSVYYKITGTAPSRILIINWYLPVPKNLTGTANSLIQVQLSETSGNITFTYGTPAVPANANMYTVGIGISTTDFASVTPTSATVATCSFTTANNNVTISPGQYTRYNFFADVTAPTITYSTIPNSDSLLSRTLYATIGGGVDTITVPRIYFKKNFNGIYNSAAGTQMSGTSTSGVWKFIIDQTLIGANTPRDSVYYFVVAQDKASWKGSPNIYSLPTGVVATSVNTIITYPTTPNAYKITGALLSGTKTIGVGGDYTSLSNAGGLFEDLNDGKLISDLTVNIITDITNETGVKQLATWLNDIGGPYKVTINPVGDRIISGTSIITLKGTKNLIIDGLNDGSNSLNIIASGNSAVNLSFGASNIILKRLTLKGTGSVINFSDASGTFPKNWSDNIIENCIIDASSASKGIYFGSWVSAAGTGNIIRNNIIKNFSQYGIHLDRGGSNFIISGNEIFQTTGSNYSIGIYTYLSPNTDIFNNKIYGLRSGTSLGQSTSGISLTGSGLFNIYNNVISLEASGTNINADKIFGIAYGSANGSVYNNSIYIGGVGVVKGNSACFYRSGTGAVNFKNNLLFNARSDTSVSIYYKNYGMIIANLTGLTSNNNLIYANGISSIMANIGADPGMSTGTNYQTLAAWRTATNQDLNSVSANPGLLSLITLQPDVDNPLSGNLNAKGTPVALVTTDILGNTRDVNKPDIGAYEFTPTLILYTVSGQVLPAVDGGNVTITWNDNGTKTTTTDAQGNYSFSVPMGWTGDITPSKTDYIITPALIHIDNIQTDLTNQNFQIEIKYVVANLKVFLQGPYQVDGTMLTYLNQFSMLPLTSATPYPALTYGYTPSTLASMPNADVVDWVLVELRTSTTTKVMTRAGLLTKSGAIVDLDGLSPLKFSSLNSGDYYVVVRHRNHLAVMSSNVIPLSPSSALYDFTTSQTQAFGTNPLMDLTGTNTVFGMLSGDADGDGNVNVNDYNSVGFSMFTIGYLIEDQNLNVGVSSEDFNYIGLNLFKSSQVPGLLSPTINAVVNNKSKEN